MSTEYIQKKQALQYMINHYESQCLRYLDYESIYSMTIDDINVLYQYDQGMIDKYQQELMLLEAKNILGLI